MRKYILRVLFGLGFALVLLCVKLNPTDQFYRNAVARIVKLLQNHKILPICAPKTVEDKDKF